MQDPRTQRHVVFALHLHLVFVTKYRKKVFTDLMMERLKYHFQRVCKDFGCRLIETNGENDHVHLLVEERLLKLSGNISKISKFVLVSSP